MVYKITDYADRLLKDLDKIQWPERIKIMQKNWIGKSQGTEILFEINGEKWPIFTTRPDTIYGVTFMVISSQHPRLMELVTEKQKNEIEKFLKRNKTIRQEEIDWNNQEQTIAFYKTKCFCGKWCIRLVTDKLADGYWQRSRFVALDRGNHHSDLIQPFEEGFNLLYGKNSRSCTQNA